MNYFNRITCLLGMLLFCLFLSAQEKQLVIFSTNDMHARINNFGKIAAYIEDFKAQNPKTQVLVMSGGDLFSGNPVVDQYEDKGYPIVHLMNLVGYNFHVFGNHEFDYGQETLNKRIAQADFPFLCANIHAGPDATLVQPDPYAIIKIGKIKVGIVSVIECSLHGNGMRYPACHPDRVKGITFTDPVESIQEYKFLRKKCNLFLGLSHAGIDADLKIADAMPELDAIVGGHTHTRIDSLLLQNGVMVTQTGCYTEGLGKLTFTFKGKKLIKKEYELIDVRKLRKANEEINQVAQDFVDKSPLKSVLAEAVDQLNGKEELGGLMCDAVVDKYGLDFCVQNSGGVRIGQLKKGPVTMADVYSLDPFGNTIVIYQMSYSQLCDLLKNSYRKASKRADLMCSGLKYTVFTKDGVATRVEVYNEDGTPVDQNRTFRVGMNSYISSSYRFDKSGLLEESDKSAADALIEYLKKIKTVKKVQHRTKVIEE